MNSSMKETYCTFAMELPKGKIDLSDVETPCFWLRSNGKGKDLLALGRHDEIRVDTLSAWNPDHLKSRMGKTNWWFGYAAFELKDAFEPVKTTLPNPVENLFFHFIQPQVVLEWDDREALVSTLLTESETRILIYSCFGSKHTKPNPPIILEQQTDRASYLSNAAELTRQIQRGNIYELNYCMEFSSHQEIPAPFQLYEEINERTKAPFSGYVNLDGLYIMCGSPESFLKKTGNRVEMKPIKGTISRGGTSEEDNQLSEKLLHDPKERSENIMIVDLVRNDLSKSAEPGSVRVDEQCKVYPFETVFQMISTVSSVVSESVGFIDLMVDCFPPGSMTGAPKVSALKLTDLYEKNQRGIYSGCIGFVRPGGDFEMNVVIRTIIYNSRKPYISLWVGSALTAACKPEKEYEECLLKAHALRQVLEFEPIIQ